MREPDSLPCQKELWNDVIPLPEKSCPKCGAKMPENTKFCERCGALLKDRPRYENVTSRFEILWKGFFKFVAYPAVFCFIVSSFLYTLAIVGESLEWIRWTWLGMMTPLVIVFGFVGSAVLLSPKTFHTRKEYVAFSALLIGLPIGLLIYTVLVLRGVLPFPQIK